MKIVRNAGRDSAKFELQEDNGEVVGSFATREEVTEGVLEKEREIFTHQAKESGKPENIIEKIVVGKMEKFYEENCVLEQPFIKDTNVTIGELIKQKIALLGENINIGQFSRFEI